MIVKKRAIPVQVLTLEALLRRMSTTHPNRKKVEEELLKRNAGYQGERSVDYHLKFLPEGKYKIFSDIRLAGIHDTFFQIDTLLITEQFLIILEVKNINGTLVFDQTFEQLLRTSNEKEDAFADPILQLKRQKQQLQIWLKKHKIPPLPIYSFVVISQPSSIIKATTHHVSLSEKVIRAAALPYKIEEIVIKPTDNSLSSLELERLCTLLTKYHIEPSLKRISHFEISPSDIICGVHCPDCFTLPISKVRGGWRCLECSTIFQKAHVVTLIDYFLLIQSSITNKQCRHFLQIPTLSPATKLLHSLNLPHVGTYRNRSYQLSLKRLQKQLCGE